MYAKVLRFNTGYGRPQVAEQVAVETQRAMSRHAGYDSMELLADYLSGRYMLIAYWQSENSYYDFSYSADARKLEQTILAWQVGVPTAFFYQVYQPLS